MKILSFDGEKNYRLKRDPDQGYLFNLFHKNITMMTAIPLQIYIVPREYEMRLDRISEHIYGTTDYVEELMTLNDLVNPYCVKEGQYIYFCPIQLLSNLYTMDEMLDEKEKKRQELIKSTQPNRSDKTPSDQNLPVNIKPSNLSQIKTDQYNNVKIINKFQ